jgi:hypothetical protein
LSGSERWVPGIGDPTFMGWFTVAAYLAAAILSGACALRRRKLDRPRGIRRHAAIWWGLATLLFLLGINKQLDLQSWFTELGRDLAKTQGWYEQRAVVQKVFIASIAAGGGLLLLLTAWIMRKDWRQHRLALIGVICLVTFVVIRAASFHKVDLFLQGVPNWLLELSGIACVGVAAVLQLRRSERT